jgi:hypothetical protein
MPVAIVQDWIEEETERSTTNYDAVSERLREGAMPPDGMLVHAAGFTGQGFRIFEVWETREHFDRFLAERLMPLLAEHAPADAAPPQLTVYEVHGLMTA